MKKVILFILGAFIMTLSACISNNSAVIINEIDYEILQMSKTVSLEMLDSFNEEQGTIGTVVANKEQLESLIIEIPTISSSVSNVLMDENNALLVFQWFPLSFRNTVNIHHLYLSSSGQIAVSFEESDDLGDAITIGPIVLYLFVVRVSIIQIEENITIIDNEGTTHIISNNLILGKRQNS